MLGLTLVWLAVVPCEAHEAEAARLVEVARRQPESLDEAVAELEARSGGWPLKPPRGEAGAEDYARAVGTRLEAACAQWEEAQREEAPTRGDKARLQAILERPEFLEARQRQGDVVERLMREFVAWMEGLLQTQGAQSFALRTRTAVLALAVAVLLFGLIRAWRWRRAPKHGGSSTGAEAARPRVLDSPGEHLARARAALGGEPREAIREGLLGLLSWLESRRLARPDRVKTNQELVAELPGRGAPPGLVGEVTRLVRWYDRAFYSLAPVSEEEARRFVDDVERLHRQEVQA